MSIKDIVGQCEGFDWDDGNFHKNWDRHDVTYSECEQIFFNLPLLIADDYAHGDDDDDRYLALGRTDMNRSSFLHGKKKINSGKRRTLRTWLTGLMLQALAFLILNRRSSRFQFAFLSQ